MRLLFAMYHPGFIRLFEPVVRELLRRGHELHLLFDRPARLGEDKLIDELTRTYDKVSVGYLPKAKRDPWVPLASRFRHGADYLRYLDPRYGGASKLHDRAKAKAPRWIQMLGERLLARSPALWRLAMRVCEAVEGALPVRRPVLEAIRRIEPDLVLVTPLVVLGSDQVDFVKACRQLGIHCALGVASWDNLTNKGVIRVRPERVFVWNQQQKREAIELHGFAAEAVEVCGAWSFDHWFDWQPSKRRSDFMAQVGLAGDGPYLLYVCSSKFIAPYEVDHVRAWIEALRSSDDESLRDLGILIRPHPQNAEQWEGVDHAAYGNVAVWPKGGANPIDEDSRSSFFNSIYFSAAIVGLNTSAQVESGIIGRPVFTVMTPEFAGTQEGTLHFHYLSDEAGGLLFSARSFPEHCRQLARVLAEGSGRERSRRFVESFIRPQGFDRPAAPLIVGRLEELAGAPPPAPLRLGLAGRLLRLTLAPLQGRAEAATAKPGKTQARTAR